ncbi:MAG TPA: hypothetical protein VNZ52_10415 [Candidatus Thermoplasmatota archaeon]|nr:hypothetical protein [Candidatus Thermoplasmatota archaeon]
MTEPKPTMGPRLGSIALAALLLLATTPALARDAAAPQAVESVEGAATPPGESNPFLTLAALFTESPSAGLSLISAGDGIVCGEREHCSYMDCDTDCPPETTKHCKCKATTQKCEDDHNWLNPFDNDEHTTYQCECSCRQHDPPPEEPNDPQCTIKVKDIICVRETGLPGTGEPPSGPPAETPKVPSPHGLPDLSGLFAGGDLPPLGAPDLDPICAVACNPGRSSGLADLGGHA